jgi:hypothetical protein
MFADVYLDTASQLWTLTANPAAPERRSPPMEALALFFRLVRFVSAGYRMTAGELVLMCSFRLCFEYLGLTFYCEYNTSP